MRERICSSVLLNSNNRGWTIFLNSIQVLRYRQISLWKRVCPKKKPTADYHKCAIFFSLIYTMNAQSSTWIMSSTMMEIDVQQCDLFSYALQHAIPLKSYECLFIFEITIKPLLHIWVTMEVYLTSRYKQVLLDW
jgi:hypothetical protein